jgi:hypothetical protein
MSQAKRQEDVRPDFARGQEKGEGPHARPDFARGQETRPRPVQEGDFAEGQEQEQHHPEEGYHGRFSRGQEISGR